MHAISKIGLGLILASSTLIYANPSFLAADQAFQFSTESISTQQVELKWKIAPHYYLYHDQFVVSTNSKKLELSLPKGENKQDPTFGLTEVHYNQVSAQFQVQPNTDYKIQWQGCSQDGLCYPLQHRIIRTDSDGLIPQDNTTQTHGFGSTTFESEINLTSHSNKPQTTGFESVPNSEISDSINPIQVDQNADPMSLQWNDDQSFFKLLSPDSFFFNILIFFALGILLAFLPCSLPLIPILSTLLIQRHSGYRAAMIAGSFVVSMATVYSLIGIVVAELGYSFQRWFQNSIALSLFAVLFVIFALNLFGLFQFNLPNALTRKLNDLQDKQKNGTFLGAAIMGALSALIVGPCMSAPLAGALLFVSQSQSTILGGVYLFILGLGIGLPLFIASVFGSRLLPKPGIWMNHVKVSFGFLMLFMAIYFIQPILGSTRYTALFAIICIVFGLYLCKAFKDSTTLMSRVFLSILVLLSTATAFWNIKLSYQNSQIQQLEYGHLVWNTVTTASELNQALQIAQQQNTNAVIDVYADWCVACQPLEKEVFPRADVQTALKNSYLIKLDLSNYNASQDLILKQHEILGPPTFIFIAKNGQEIRELRLTGAFKAELLIQQLERLNTL